MKGFRPRSHERARHLGDVLLGVPPHAYRAPAHTLDLDRGGVRIFTGRSLAPGDDVEVTWPGPDGPLVHGGRVAYVQPDTAGLFAGVRFHRPLSPEELGVLRSLKAGGARRLV